LQDAEQFGLEREWDFGDFIEKQIARVGEFEWADAVLKRAGKGTLDMAEEFAPEEILGNGCAIYFDERAGTTRTAFVNGARDQFPAGAGFALDQ
jgi:hypothetical protein